MYENPILWIQQMNNLQNRAREVVNNEIIFR
ncbi:MAG: TnpV protein [Clostridia bacterium]|nr:TnpV protein [Clostridia bacterium]